MAESYWKTGTPAARRQHVIWPALAQILRQLGAIALVGLLWAALLAGYLRLTAGQTQAQLAAREESVAALASPTATQTPLATETSTPATEEATPPAPTVTLTPPTSDTPPPSTQTATPEPTASQPPSPEAQPSPTASATPTPLPTATEPAAIATNTPAPAEGGTALSFSGDVLPIFQRRCVNCHGGEKTEEGLILKSYAEVIAGSWNGPVVEPGNSGESLLVEMISSGKMPKKGPRLLPAQVRAIIDWIDAGAPDN